MMTRWRSCVACLVLLLATVPFSAGPIHALQCNTPVCIRVAFAADPLNNNWNKFCWLQFTAPDGSFWGQARSLTYAANGYGTTDLAGGPINARDGFKVLCAGSLDCPGAPISQSGTVTAYLDTAKPDNFPTDCGNANTGTGGTGP